MRSHLVSVSGREVSVMHQERSCVGDNCGNAGSGPENENQAAESEGEGEKKEVRGVILGHQEKSGLPEKLHE